MSKCAVIGCKSEHNPFNSGVTFHRVTRNKKYLPLWERVVKIKSKSVHAKICSLHFKELDFVEGRGCRVLKPGAVPSINIVEKDSSTDDDDDNEKLSLLKRALSTHQGEYSTTGGVENTTQSDSDEYDHNPILPQNFQMVVPCTCCNSVQSSNSLIRKETSNMGVQTKMKTSKEVSLQAKVKLLELRLRRRDAKISYMQTVLNMIKKHTKGTDVEYKLCCELQNISEFSETIESNQKDKRKSNRSKIINGTVESPVSEVSSGDEDTCTFFEVVHSPNLKAYNGFS
ncbi:uncharacterized protein LOC134745020 [Cydia strobilella]|uniref:uncharacterized protein LOC134745020 n=1 Tax=Cydia strobilella TaxID=1100964 RepID=UPI00300596B5